MLTLKTPRLELIPYSLEIAQAAMSDKSQIERLLAVQVADDWPWEEVRDALPFFAQLAADPNQLGWGAWLIIHSAQKTIIGDLGFGGKPDETGKVEMGYNIVSGYRNQGYGFEAVQALVNWAIAQPSLNKILASCPSDNIPSIRILEKLGMQCLGNFEGILKWELTRKWV